MSADHEDWYDPHSERAQDLVTTMQDALLPSGLVVLPHVDIAARYLLADERRGAGGDWFDAVPLAGGRVALVVGDVVGVGVGAAALMGQLRAVFAAALTWYDEPLEALAMLDRFASVAPEARAATLTIVVIDPARPELHYCTAGHPPPLVVTAAGATPLPTTGGRPLGYRSAFTMATHPLDPGDLVVLYSDGLVRRPGVAPATGLRELVRLVEDVRRREPPGARQSLVERICDGAAQQLTADTGYEDDIALVAAQRLPTEVPELRLDLPAVPDTVRVARLELGAWLAALRVSAIDQLALQQAMSELVTNVIEHAYPEGSHARDTSVRVLGRLTLDGEVAIEVSDDGRWRPPEEHQETGRGLAMARGFVDDLEVRPGETGTSVRLGHRVLRPASLLTGAFGHDDGASGWPEPMTVRRPRRDVLEVRGAVVHTAADRMAVELRRAVNHSPVPVQVDLTDVSLLSSGGVQVLFEALDDALPKTGQLVICAAPGSLAQHVLELAQLPYEPRRPSSE